MSSSYFGVGLSTCANILLDGVGTSRGFLGPVVPLRLGLAERHEAAFGEGRNATVSGRFRRMMVRAYGKRACTVAAKLRSGLAR